MAETDGLRVFISYSHKDEPYREQLQAHLSLLKRQGHIDVWQDRKLLAGGEFDQEIMRELEEADLILLLASSDFMASDYCHDKEMKRAIERHEAGEARVVPVILRPCDWRTALFGKLTALPTDAIPVKKQDADEAFLDIANGIRRIAEEDRPRRRPNVNEPASGWHVPHGRNRNFTGRVELLRRLHEDLTSNDRAAPRVLLGLGGIGKTQTAIEYAYRHREDYKLVWWLRAGESSTLAADYAALAGHLGLTEKKEQEQAIAAVRDRLDEVDGWLLIFDNAIEASDLRPYLPARNLGRVIITSRNPNWGAIARPVRVELMGEEDAVALLLQHRSPDEAEDVRELAAALGWLPLALAQAQAYCEHVGCTLRHYLTLLKAREAELLAQPYTPEGYDVPVAAAWDLAFETLKQTTGAQELLEFLASIPGDGIKLSTITAIAPRLRGSLAEICGDTIQFNRAFTALRRALLVEFKDDTIFTHRLVREIARFRLSLSDQFSELNLEAKLDYPPPSRLGRSESISKKNFENNKISPVKFGWHNKKIRILEDVHKPELNENIASKIIDSQIEFLNLLLEEIDRCNIDHRLKKYLGGYLKEIKKENDTSNIVILDAYFRTILGSVERDEDAFPNAAFCAFNTFFEQHKKLRILYPDWLEYNGSAESVDTEKTISKEIAEDFRDAIVQKPGEEIFDESVSEVVEVEIDQPDILNGKKNTKKSYDISKIISSVWKVFKEAPTAVKSMDSWNIVFQRLSKVMDSVKELL